MKFLTRRRFCLPLLVGVLLSACNTPEYLSESALAQFVQDSKKLSKTVLVNDTRIKVTFRPVDLLVAQELGTNSNPSPERVQALREKFQRQYYFIVSLSRSDKEVLSANPDMSSFSQMVGDLSFRMSEVVNLTTSGQDTIPVADYVLNRTFGMSNSTDLLFAFDKSKTFEKEWVNLNLDEFGLGIGKQSIQFNISDLETVPKIYNLN